MMLMQSLTPFFGNSWKTSTTNENRNSNYSS